MTTSYQKKMTTTYKDIYKDLYKLDSKAIIYYIQSQV